jgi:hypothetical protein
MTDYSVADSILVPFRRWQFDLIWGALALFAGLAAIADLLTARTSGGQLVGGLLFGGGCVLCLLGWANMRRHPSLLQVTAEAITRGYEGRPKTTSLWKVTSPDLGFVLVGMSRSRYWALVQAGSDTQLDVQGFRKQDVERACLQRGWRFPT